MSNGEFFSIQGGPVKLFVPYTKTKRKRRDGEGSVSSKRLSTGGEENLRGILIQVDWNHS